MARARRFAHNVISSYLAMGVNIIYSITTVPLALSFLSKEQFGLWALLMQLVGYLGLIDMGINGAATRLLIDHKDDASGMAYAKMYKTSCIVAVVQAALVLLIGFILAPWLPHWLETPPELRSDFTHLLRWQAAITASSFLTRPLWQLLWAHQRMDIPNYGGILQLSSGLLCLWFFFRQGYGLHSYLYSNAVGSGLMAVYLLVMCKALELFPSRVREVRASWESFREVFSFGKDLLLVTLGSQLIMASQIIILTRCLGLDVAATWTVGTRVFNMVIQFIWRFFDSAGPALGEMMARREHAKLFQRYGEIVILSLSAAGVAAVIFAATNSQFVAIWTSGKIQWRTWDDCFLGIWIVALVGVHAFNGFILQSKELRGLRWVCFGEGFLFVVGSLLLLRIGGISTMISVSIVCCLLCSGVYAVRRVAAFFQCSWKIVAFKWSAPMILCVATMAPVAFAVSWAASKWMSTVSPVLRLSVTGTILAVLGTYCFFRFGIPGSLRNELLTKMPAKFRPVLGMLIPTT